jgi:electron transport complex protein RnfG
MAENNAKAPERESNFKALVLPVIVLVVICLVCSALLAVLNNATAPIIEANTKAETLAAYLSCRKAPRRMICRMLLLPPPM